MATLTADTASKISTEGLSESSDLRDALLYRLNVISAAGLFVDTYYHALGSSSLRADIASFYMPASAMPDGKPLPVIVYNGNIIPNPTAMQTMFQEQMPQARYEIQDYDCQVLNPHYVAEGTQGSSPGSGKNMTILVTVSGQVRFGEPRSATLRGFSENFVLIPNPAAVMNTRGKNIKGWLIQSQNFRIVV